MNTVQISHIKPDQQKKIGLGHLLVPGGISFVIVLWGVRNKIWIIANSKTVVQRVIHCLKLDILPEDTGK